MPINKLFSYESYTTIEDLYQKVLYQKVNELVEKVNELEHILKADKSDGKF